MNDFPPNTPQGPGGVPLPPVPRFEEPPTYAYRTRTPIIILPVMLNGLHVGYLWAGVDDESAGFIRRREFTRQAFDAPFVWIRRLREAYTQGLPAREAVRQWIGRPEDPEGGGVPADAREETADSSEALTRLADPDAEPSLLDSLFHGKLPDGTPMDRSQGWGPLHFELPPGYDLTTDGPVQYLPVVKDDLTLGYLWQGGTAAQFERRIDTAALGSAAAATWIQRLRELHARGVSPSDVLAQCRAMPADRDSGAVPPDATVQHAPTQAALREQADTYEQSLPLVNNPVPGRNDVLTRPALSPQERDAALRYLHEGTVVYDSRRQYVDGFSPDKPQNVPDTYQTDGTWIWLGGVAHHLEHHNIAPEPDLLQHIRNNNFQAPPVDATTYELAKRTLRLHRILVPPPM
ncbi:hypothetical protein GCM10022254_41100 [Actinomadura meridiana]|uniref:Uncharacterized protein n=1 Tax=Actinomadura meridiana TaxID=559626 RepID=A0ABP8C818_9ACTN